MLHLSIEKYTVHFVGTVNPIYYNFLEICQTIFILSFTNSHYNTTGISFKSKLQYLRLYFSFLEANMSRKHRHIALGIVSLLSLVYYSPSLLKLLLGQYSHIMQRDQKKERIKFEKILNSLQITNENK